MQVEAVCLVASILVIVALYNQMSAWSLHVVPGEDCSSVWHLLYATLVFSSLLIRLRVYPLGISSTLKVVVKILPLVSYSIRALSKVWT